MLHGWAFALAAALCSVGVAGEVLQKQPLLRCSACRAVAVELLAKKDRMIEKNANPVQVSHRLGNGKWDPHGGGGVKKMTYATSELMTIDTTEDLCESSEVKGYRLKVNATDNTRLFTKDSTLSDAESYTKSDKEVAKNPGKQLTLACHELLELHDEGVAKLLREEIDGDTFTLKLCTEVTKVCRGQEKMVAKELAARSAHEEHRRSKIDKTRKEGTSRNFQLADIHLRFEGVALNLSELNATAHSESGRHPTTEGPANILDNNANTKWLDHDKKSVVLEFPVNVTIDAFTFTTANDYPERDPVRWEFAGVVEEEVDTPAAAEPEAAEQAAQQGAAPAEGGAAAQEGAEEAPASAAGEQPAEPVVEVRESWVVLHAVTGAPHDVPHNRSHQLGWFEFAAATHRKFRFKPVGKIAKKKKKQAKKAAAEEPTQPATDSKEKDSKADEL